MPLHSVKVPEAFEAVFQRAESLVRAFFGERRFDPGQGEITIQGERYVLVRAGALTVQLFQLVRRIYGDERATEADTFTETLLYDLAFSLGQSDAARFIVETDARDPLHRLACGPAVFAQVGWASVEILADSVPTGDPQSLLHYIHHHSFEADAWLSAEVPTDRPVCVMSAGYSAGWCVEALSIPMASVEVCCRAKGDAECRFVMAPPDQLHARVHQLYPEEAASPRLVASHPALATEPFARARLEAELAAARADLEIRVAQRTEELRQANLRLEKEAAERRRMQADLIQAAKLEALGRLAGGVAHDFNNLLTVIQGHADLLAADREPGSDGAADTAAIQQACLQATALTRQLLTFSRGRIEGHTTCRLAQAVRATLPELERLFPSAVDLEVDEAEDAHLIAADAATVGQILYTLALNALEAQGGGGRLSLRAEQVELCEGRVAGLPPGPYACLVVSDTGVGMDPETTARAVDPFFTTRRALGHSGLGLSVVHGALQEIGGAMTFDSTPGKGTTVKVYIPASEEPERPEPVRRRSTGPSSGTILVVDDQRELRSLIVRALIRQGYDALSAGHGKDALTQIEASEGRIDLLFTDVVMPIMGGRELAETVRRAYPHIKILFMSGYTDDLILREEIATNDVAFLAKPFRIQQAVARIREILATEPA